MYHLLNIFLYYNIMEVFCDYMIIMKPEGIMRQSENRLRLRAEKAEKDKDTYLEIIDDLCDSYCRLEGLFMGFVTEIANALDDRMLLMKGHSQRVAAYSLKIAKEMGLREEEMEKLRLAALLHDIGHIVISDEYINKPARLTNEEFEFVKKHTVKGASILKNINQLQDIVPLIKYHHERIDGNGYPDGLRGEEIPVGARILHVADSFDSMTADRPYRTAPGKEYAFMEIKRCNNTQFDPNVAKFALKVL
jgi:putative nucleotidyltransferase with HDIG domain